jgi:hypothetical protein
MRKLAKMLNQISDRSGTLGFTGLKEAEKPSIATFLSITNQSDLEVMAISDMSAILVTDYAILESYTPPDSVLVGLDLRLQNEISNENHYGKIDFAVVDLAVNFGLIDNEDCGLILEIELSEDTKGVTELIQLLQGKQALPIDAILLSGSLATELNIVKNQLNIRRFNEAVGLPLVIGGHATDADTDQLRALGIKGSLVTLG